jgi:transposase
VAQHEDPRRFKFVDETGLHLAFVRRYGRAPGGQRVSQGVPLRVGTAVTVVGALTVNGLEAVMSLDGALNQDSFATYLDQVLGPTLVPGDVVVLDNLPVHKVAGMAARVEARGARLLFLPPYSPDFAPIEQAWSKLKTALRTAAARSRQALEQALTDAVAWITTQDVQNWFDHCGYHVHSL